MERALWIASLAFTVASEAFAGPAVRIRLARGQLPVVAIQIDGRGPFDFLLDTGATATVFRSDLARSVGVHGERAIPVGTSAGDRVFLRAGRSRISLDHTAEVALAPLVSPLESLRAVDGRIQGILGMDWLSSFSFLIDYENERLVLDDSCEGEPIALRVPYRLEKRRILVPVLPESPGRKLRAPLWLVLDTGASGLLLVDRSGFAVERNPREAVKLVSAGGTRIALRGSLPRLLAGGVLLRDVPVTLLRDASALAGAAGLLPGRLFRRLYVNHREGYVVFDPDG